MLKKKHKIRYFSMFTGVGGFELGFSQCNKSKKQQREKNLSQITNSKNHKGGISTPTTEFRCVGFSEIDKYANELLKKKFPNIKNYGDATKINPRELPDFDMLCGGFPCQAFSIAGKRRGFQDTRGTLFFEITRVLEVKKPRLVLLENVKGLLNHNKGETFSVIIQTLSELGYNVQWVVLNSKFFGVPQNRERVFIIGSLGGEPKQEILPFRRINEENFKQSEKPSATITSRYYKQGNADPYITHGTITEAVGTRQGSSKEFKESVKKIMVAQQGSQAQRVFNTEGVAPTLRGLGGGQGAKTGLYAVQPVQLVNKNRAKKPYNPDNREMKFKIRNDGTSYTVKNTTHEFMAAIHSLYPGTGHLIKEPNDTYCIDTGNMQGLETKDMKIRRLTPIECERLQGFPDNWTEGFSDTQRYKMMGNAITVNVVEAIANKICS